MTDTANERPARERYAIYAWIGLATIVVGAALLTYWNRPPQMGASEEAFHTVDALYTAVRSRDEKRVTSCEQRLNGYREAGTLPAAAADSLDAIIRQARSGAWDAATVRLYEFMLAQRREGTSESRPQKVKR